MIRSLNFLTRPVCLICCVFLLILPASACRVDSWAAKQTDNSATTGSSLTPGVSGQVPTSGATPSTDPDESGKLSEIAGETVILPSPAPSPSPSAVPSGPSPTVKPTAAPTAKPTAKPTVKPTARPTAKPTAAPSGCIVNLPGVPLNWPLSATQRSKANRFIELVNQARQEAGLSALRLGGSALQQAAAIRSAELSIKFDHTRPTSDTKSDHWSELLKALNVSFRFAGENLAGGQATAEDAMAAFMGSENHRGNILSPDFTAIAVGVYTDSKGVSWWAQEFIG